MMKIHEATATDGVIVPVYLRCAERGLELVAEDGALVLPDGALARVMERYGAPLEAGTRLTEIAVLEMGDARLRHVRHLARYDVIAKDWLVYEPREGEPLCALANTVAAALGHLARAAARAPDTGS